MHEAIQSGDTEPFDASAVVDAPSVTISDPLDVVAVLRDRRMAMLQRESGHGGQYFTQIIEGSVADLWGDDHFERRRLHSTIFSPDRLRAIEAEAILPGIVEPLQMLRRESEDAEPETDLVILVRRAAIRMAGLLVGISGVGTNDDIDEFDALFRRMERGGRSKFVDNAADMIRDAMEARDELLEKFVAPVWREREAAAAKVLAGDLDASSLPSDLISLMLLNPGHYEKFPGALKGEQAVILMAGIGSSVNGVCGVVLDLLHWFAKNPGQTHLIDDAQFLLRAQQESYRLHQTNLLFRTSMYDATLPSGIEVPTGTVVIIDRPLANCALARAGVSDAGPEEFDPFRTLGQKFTQQGLAFGLGVHTCSGRPLMMGDPSSRNGENRAGFSSSVVSKLFAAGVDLVEGQPPTYWADMKRRETFKTFPVRFKSLDQVDREPS